ncbi:hypothetical protein M422DRAFT_154899, partial [Sphaerobolus stellatus SS14]
LFWVPPRNRAGLYWPGNTTVIASAPTKLNFNSFQYGKNWAECWTGQVDSNSCV